MEHHCFTFHTVKVTGLWLERLFNQLLPTKEYTVSQWKQSCLLSELSDRQSLVQWKSRGRKRWEQLAGSVTRLPLLLRCWMEGMSQSGSIVVQMDELSEPAGTEVRDTYLDWIRFFLLWFFLYLWLLLRRLIFQMYPWQIVSLECFVVAWRDELSNIHQKKNKDLRKSEKKYI